MELRHGRIVAFGLGFFVKASYPDLEFLIVVVVRHVGLVVEQPELDMRFLGDHNSPVPRNFT